MDIFLDTYGPSKLNQDILIILNRCVKSNKIKALIKLLSTKKMPRSKWIQDEFWQTFKKESTLMLLKLFHKQKGNGTGNSSYDISVTFIRILDKDMTRKQSYRPIYLMSIDT